MSFPIQPVGNKLLVLPLKRDEEEVNGIIIPGSANSELSKGKIVAVSDDIKHVYKEKDIVLYPSRSGVGCLVDGNPYLWLQDIDIWGINNS